MSQTVVNETREDRGDYYAVHIDYSDGSTSDDIEWKPGFEPAVAQAITVDPQALTDAQAAITAATTVTALRKAVVAALDLLNPAT